MGCSRIALTTWLLAVFAVGSDGTRQLHPAPALVMELKSRSGTLWWTCIAVVDMTSAIILPFMQGHALAVLCHRGMDTDTGLDVLWFSGANDGPFLLVLLCMAARLLGMGARKMASWFQCCSYRLALTDTFLTIFPSMSSFVAIWRESTRSIANGEGCQQQQRPWCMSAHSWRLWLATAWLHINTAGGHCCNLWYVSLAPDAAVVQVDNGRAQPPCGDLHCCQQRWALKTRLVMLPFIFCPPK